MTQIKESDAVVVAKKAEEAVTATVTEATNKMIDVAQAKGMWQIFDVSLWEIGIIFIIVVMLYNLFVQQFFYNALQKKNKVKRFLHYVMVVISLFIVSYGVAFFCDISIEVLVRVALITTLGICVKYVQRLLDDYFVKWSKKQFGKRAVIHNMLKDIVKRIVIVVALSFAFIVFKVSIVKLFSLDIPGYIGIVVIMPLLIRMNLLSFFSIVNRGFIIGDFIQIGNDADAISGSCIAVNFSGITLETPIGDRISMKLSQVTNAVVINRTTRHTQRSEMVYYINSDLDSEKIDECRETFIHLITSCDDCTLVQCHYVTGVTYRHELKCVFDVHITDLQKAHAVMDSIHVSFVKKCGNSFATLLQIQNNGV